MKHLCVLLLFVVAPACGAPGPSRSAATPTPQAPEFAAFVSLAGRMSDQAFEVRYHVTVAGDPDAERPEAQQDEEFFITWAQRPPERSFLLEDEEARSILIDRGDGVDPVVCSGGSCFRMPATPFLESALAPLRTLVEDLDASTELNAFEPRGTTEIAGRTARCAAWNSTLAPVEACLDEETGAVLSWQETGGAVRWEAVSVGQPTDADFEPFSPVR